MYSCTKKKISVKDHSKYFFDSWVTFSVEGINRIVYEDLWDDTKPSVNTDMWQQKAAYRQKKTKTDDLVCVTSSGLKIDI